MISTQISLRGAPLTVVILERQGLAYTRLFRDWRPAGRLPYEKKHTGGVLGGGSTLGYV